MLLRHSRAIHLAVAIQQQPRAKYISVRTSQSVNSELMKPRRRRRRRRRGHRSLKLNYILYQRISRYSEVIYFVDHRQNVREIKSGTPR